MTNKTFLTPMGEVRLWHCPHCGHFPLSLYLLCRRLEHGRPWAV